MVPLGRWVGKRETDMIVSVVIKGKDRMVGAMVKALAVEVAGYRAVNGMKKEFLNLHGYYDFNFPSDTHASDFREAVKKYLPEALADIRL